MFEAGSRSKQISTFTLPEDEAAFDGALAPAIVGLGQWETHDQRARTVTPHDSLPAHGPDPRLPVDVRLAYA
ncbi:hypothetical protein AB0B31_35215 [Catellatospora citrea]|uniref:hypothetical protein n=1 Tax=Catellatospora citrea TaxID=53366 RepID=UPI003402B4B2